MFGGKRKLDDFTAEIEAHLQLETERLREQGLNEGEAREAARRAFGNLTQVQERFYESTRWLWLDQLWRDVRFGLRMLSKSPGFTAVAVLTLALGIGANTAIFSIMNAVMLTSLPVRDPNGLVVLQWSANKSHNGRSSSYGDCPRKYGEGRNTGCSVSYPMFQELRGHGEIFSSVAAFAGPSKVVVGGLGQASVAQAEVVSGNYFEALGVRPAAGQVMQDADEKRGAEAVVVLSYGYWHSALGSSESAIGKVIRLNNSPFRIIGVADAGFVRLTPGKVQDMWVPLPSAVTLGDLRAEDLDDPATWWLTTVARVKDGVGVAKARASASLLFRNSVVHGAKPPMKEDAEPSLDLIPAQHGLTGFRATLRTPLYILTAAVGMVLLISCANVAGLMLARARAREKEMATRAALGASRGRIIWQLLTESVLLSTAGGALGILLAYWGAGWLALFVIANSRSRMILDVAVSGKVLAYTAVTAVLTGIVFGLAPALWGGWVDAAPALKDNGGNLSRGGHAGSRKFGMGSALVIGQVALSVVVLIGAGLLVRTLHNLKSVNPGFETRNLLHFELHPELSGYPKERLPELYDEMQKRLAALPGVVSVSCASGVLLDGGLWTSGVHVEGDPKEATVETDMLAVGTDYFKTMQIPLVSGRSFSAADMRSKHETAVVNESFVRRVLKGRNAIGTRLSGTSDNNESDREIVGVVKDAKYDQLRDDAAPTTYVPMKQGMVFFEMRTEPKPETLIPAVRKLVNDVNENLPLFDVRTQTDTIDQLLFNERLVTRLSSLFGLLALVLACVGLYGLLSYEVTRRTREIGIRTALGAQRSGVLQLVMGQGLFLTVAGAVVGIGGAIWLTRYLASLLYGVPATDVATFVSVAGLLQAVAFLACWIPARRATRVEPIVALRYE